MTWVFRMRWLAVALAGLCVIVLAPGAAGYAAARPAQARHDQVAAVPAGGAPLAATGNLTAVACVSAADCLAVGSAFPEFANVISTHSVAEHWNGRTWTGAGSPGPVVSAVACPQARVCQAVGGGSAERWNGRAWIREKTPAGLGGDSLTGVSCPAASACVAVGTRVNGRPPMAETWNGSYWAAHNLVNPPGALQASLSAVSCTARSACIAVGSYQSAAGQATLAEKWNGSTWTMLAMPPAATMSAGLTGVSCATSASCVAVGSDGRNPLAESWNGMTWTVLPAPPDQSQAVSCTSAAHCVAVGRIAAMTWNGSTWTVPLGGSTGTGLTGVSCVSSASCMAVGGSNFAMSWNGAAWRVLRVYHVDGLSAISCTLATRCMAAGSFVTASGRDVALTESWNGSSWRRRAASEAVGAALSDVSCTSAARCIAVGAIGDSANLAEAWNGTAWQVMPTPPPSFPTGLGTVSCRGVTCVTINSFFGDAWRWNGTAWQSIQSAAGVYDVSCARPDYCMTAGAAFISPDDPPVSLAQLWNGKAWQKPKDLPGDGLNAVSCTSASFCMAAGGNTAVIWNGTSWRTRTLPGSFGIATDGATVISRGITGVSCVRRSACMAVGNYLARVGSRYEGFNVAEFWNGTRWRRLATPGPGGGLTDVSCTSASRCIAVGLSPIWPAGTSVLVERWNGRRWSLLATPSP